MEILEDRMIELRGQRVALTPGSYLRGWIAYQGGDYFEFRPDGAGGWLLSQSAEWDCHDPSHVVGRGATMQAAAEDFARSVTRRTSPRPDAPSATRRRELVTASIDDLVSELGAAMRLGYDDGRAGLAPRTGNAVAYALGLSRWSGLQQLQLRQAYVTGRQHGVSERRRGDTRSTAPSGQVTASGAAPSSRPRWSRNGNSATPT
jgi:hypothetical protein